MRTPEEQARLAQHVAEGTAPRSSRGLFYDLRLHGMGHGVTYVKDAAAEAAKWAKEGRLHHRWPDPYGRVLIADPQAVQEVINQARHAFLIDEDLIADGRSPEQVGLYFDRSVADVVDAVVAYVEDAAQDYRLDPQTGQPIRLEIWSEAHDLTPRIERIATPLGVPVFSGAGFTSLKPRLDTARRIAGRDEPTVTLFLGDLDTSGAHILGAFEEDVRLWITVANPLIRGSGRPADHWRIERLGITEEQARRFGVLDEDGHAEADAIPIPELDVLVRDAIVAHTSAEALAALQEREATERDLIGPAIRDRVNGAA